MRQLATVSLTSRVPVGVWGTVSGRLPDLLTGGAFLHMIPVAEGVLVLHLGAFEHVEGDRPVGGVHAGCGDCARVPLGIRRREAACDVDSAPSGIGAGGYCDGEGDGHRCGAGGAC